MNPPYTYKNRFGVYYFRLVITERANRPKTEIRFSLQTRVASEARIRSYRAWLLAHSMAGENELTFTRADIQSHVLRDDSVEQLRPIPKPFTPDLVTLSQFIGSDDRETIQNAITRIINSNGRIFISYEDEKCAAYRIHDPQYEDAPAEPIAVEPVPRQNVVLTKKVANAARFSKEINFEVDEFYSYDPTCWTEQSGFSVRLEPHPPFLANLTELLVAKDDAEALPNPNQIFSSVSPNVTQKPRGHIGQELSQYSDDKRQSGNWTARTKRDSDSIFQTFVEVIGDKFIHEITQEDINTYVKVLNHLPTNRMKNPKFAKLSALQAASLNAECGGAVISTRSKNKYMERLNGPFENFVISKDFPYNFFDVVSRYKVTRSDALGAREPFSADDLRSMFEGDDSIRMLKAKKHMPSRPWGLLIALYTGARASEIFSLTTQDIKEYKDTLYFDINDRDGHNRVKNDASVRGIPVHPKLLELGFKNYLHKSIAAQSNAPLQLLFPDIQKSDIHGWSRNTTRWINEKYLPRVGIKTDKLKVFHSFRHTLADKFKRNWKANPLKISTYFGHSDDYGKLPEWQKGYGSPFAPNELIEVTEVIDFGLDFTKLKSECLDKIRLKKVKAPARKKKPKLFA